MYLLPSHVLPSGCNMNPFWQEQLNAPTILPQMWSQSCWLLEHSSISIVSKKKHTQMNGKKTVRNHMLN